MNQALIFSRLNLEAKDYSRLLRFRESTRKRLEKAIPGFISMTLWQSGKEEDMYTMLAHYETVESASDALTYLAKNGVLLSAFQGLKAPPDVLRARAITRLGKAPDELLAGNILSLSRRQAEPGYGSQLVHELERIFLELSNIKGFLGSAACYNEVISDEAVGVAFWEDESSFKKSLPKKSIYEVGFYRKLA